MITQIGQNLNAHQQVKEQTIAIHKMDYSSAIKTHALLMSTIQERKKLATKNEH
jgi:uncharacterized protein